MVYAEEGIERGLEPTRVVLEQGKDLSNDELQNLIGLSSLVLASNVHTEGHDSGYTTPSGLMRVEGHEPVRLYPHQWLWDAFFIAAEDENLDQAVTDIHKFLSGQRPDGFLGHIRYNREAEKYFPGYDIYYPHGVPEGELMSKITQPPNVAYGVWEVAKRIGEASGIEKQKEFIQDVYPKVLAYHSYIYNNLVYRDSGLMVTNHPWAGGDDNSPKWKSIYARVGQNQRAIDLVNAWEASVSDSEKSLPWEVKINHFASDWLHNIGLPYERFDIKWIDEEERPINTDYDMYIFLIALYDAMDWDDKRICEESPFRVADPMINSILLRSDTALLEMAELLEKTEDQEMIGNWIKQTKKGLSTLWDETDQLYYARDLETDTAIRTKTISAYLPLFSGMIEQERADAIIGHIHALETKATYMVPSTDPDSSYYNPRRYWEGPVWIVINALLEEGCRMYGYTDVAARIRRDTLYILNLTKDYRGGFFEYFSPNEVSASGDGCYGSPEQSWSAAMAIKLAKLELRARSM